MLVEIWQCQNDNGFDTKGNFPIVYMQLRVLQLIAVLVSSSVRASR